jgi:hypothetical protein
MQAFAVKTFLRVIMAEEVPRHHASGKKLRVKFLRLNVKHGGCFIHAREKPAALLQAKH